MNLARVFADAAALWQRDRDLWLRIAGFFFFMPALALYWFAPLPDVDDLAPEVARKAVVQWFESNAIGLLGFMLIITFGYGVVLTLLLDDKRPALGSGIARALRLLPALALTSFVVGLLVSLGLFALFVPGLYIAGRTFLALPALAAEPKRGPIGALVTAVQRSHGRGWLLCFVVLTAVVCTQLAASAAGALGAVLGSDIVGSPAHLVSGIVLAAVAAAGALAQALLQAAAYRAADGARQGI